MRDAGSKYAETRLRTSEHWKAGIKSFPTVYDNPILLYIGMSYTVGKLLKPAFCLSYRDLRTSHVLSPGVPEFDAVCSCQIRLCEACP